MTKRIAIDLFPIRVGEGGTGSGIWTYARELLHAMDRQVPNGMEIRCLVNEGQIPFLSDLQHIQLIRFRSGGKSILRRLLWVHVQLPMYCLINRVHVLHKLATDTPFFCTAKRVTTVHDFYYEFLVEKHPSQDIRLYERLENFYFSLVTRTCFKKSTAIIAVSNATREEALRRYPKAQGRITVIHHGAPVAEPLAPSQQLSANSSSSSSDCKLQTTNCKPDTFRVLCVAKFMEHKGQHLLIKAVDQLLEQYPELVEHTRLTLRGFHNDSDYYDTLCQMVADSYFASNICIQSFNPADTIVDIYHNADLVVLLSSYEGFGLPVLEAQSMGVPVLCADLPVLNEVGGEGAVYVDRENTVQVAESIYRLITDSGYRTEQRNKALENINRFSWDDAARQTINIYQSCSAIGR